MGPKSVERAIGINVKAVSRFVGMGSRAAGRGVGRGSKATGRDLGGVDQGSRATSVIMNSTYASIRTQTSQGSQYATWWRKNEVQDKR